MRVMNSCLIYSYSSLSFSICLTGKRRTGADVLNNLRRCQSILQKLFAYIKTVYKLFPYTIIQHLHFRRTIITGYLSPKPPSSTPSSSVTTSVCLFFKSSSRASSKPVMKRGLISVASIPFSCSSSRTTSSPN